MNKNGLRVGVVMLDEYRPGVEVGTLDKDRQCAVMLYLSLGFLIIIYVVIVKSRSIVVCGGGGYIRFNIRSSDVDDWIQKKREGAFAPSLSD